MKNKLYKANKILLKNHPEINESMIQDMIAKNPSMLELGNLMLRDKERRQPRAGRLDLLLQDTDDNRRYEVEIQLGTADESHIIRCIEYWDIERKRYPQYDHCAVIIAEDITSRFLNVISLFNGSIPIIAIQMNAFNVDDKTILSFTTVLDEMHRGLVDEDEGEQFIATRDYWQKERASKQTLSMMDDVFDLIKEIQPNAEVNYTKGYVGVQIDGKSNNFVSFIPKRNVLTFQIKLKYHEETSAKIEQSGLESLEYNKRFKFYNIRIAKEDLQKRREFIKALINDAYESRFNV